MRALVGGLVLIAVLTGWVAPALAGSARPVQDGDGPTTSVTTPDPETPDEGIIPEPDSGRAPEEAGDRGGVLQLLLLALIVIGVGLIALQVVRQARRNQAGTGSPM